MVLGHKNVIDDLKQLAESKSLPHGYIFFGPAMVGKRTVALHLAGFLETGRFEESAMLSDALIIEPTADETISIDEVRKLKRFLWQKPNVSFYRTAIIDNAELLTREAQNAILKIAEEPPPSTFLILIASDIDGIAPTILSRLQKIYFSVQPKTAIKRWLAEQFGLDDTGAAKLAEKSFGKPGLAAAFLENKELQGYSKLAADLLKSTERERPSFIKNLLQRENFNFTRLLDAMIIHLISGGLKRPEKIKRWHKFLSLRQEVAYFNLNPRLQLQNLFYDDSDATSG
jgi:DNA polymerase-3 subunit delta'